MGTRNERIEVLKRRKNEVNSENRKGYPLSEARKALKTINDKGKYSSVKDNISIIRVSSMHDAVLMQLALF